MAALVRLLSLTARRRYRLTMLFLATSACVDVALFPIYGKPVFYQAYFIAESILALLAVFLVAELFIGLCDDYPGLDWVGIWVVNIAGGAAVLAGICGVARNAANGFPGRFARIVIVSATVAALASVFLAVGLWLLTRMPVPVRANAKRLVAIFAIFFAAEAAGRNQAFHLHSPIWTAGLNLFRMVAGTGALIWLVVKVNPAGEQIIDPPAVDGLEELAADYNRGAMELARGAREMRRHGRD